MDPISVAVTGALAKLSEQAVKDAYDALKALIASKFGKKSDLAKAVEGVEKKPESEGRKETLQEEVAAAKADQDQELVRAARQVLDLIKTQPGAAQIIQTASGNQDIQVAGDRNEFHTNDRKS